jgi:hypothetical protein
MWGTRHCVCGGEGGNFNIRQGPLYIHRLTNECTTTYIIDQPMNIGGLCSLVDHTFLGFGTEEYRTIIFLGNQEDKKPRNIPPFTCSIPLVASSRGIRVVVCQVVLVVLLFYNDLIYVFIP